jgi:hypothetical protein
MVLDTVLPLPPRLAAAAAASGGAVPSPFVSVSRVAPHLFGDIQGKVEQLGGKFPIIRGLLGNISIPSLHSAALIFCYAMMQLYYSLLCNITFPMNSLQPLC